MRKYPMTVYGAECLRQELHELKFVRRPQIIEAIATARAHGDLKENAEYHAAREQQSFAEGRIKDIESKLAAAQVVDISAFPNDGKVIFGSTISLINLNTNETVTYQIVGDDEADLKHNKISINSPIARAIIGKFEGDSIDVNAPSGIIPYEIAQVDYIAVPVNG
jgi:transcription elongation factor GreA